MKRYLALLFTIEIQIKTTMKYHLPPVKMTIIKKSAHKKCWRDCGEKSNPSILLVGK